MTVPYTPNATWADETAKKQAPRQTDILDMGLGQRFGVGQPAQTQGPQAPALQAQGVARGTQSGSSGVPGSTPMFGQAPMAPVNPFRPRQPMAQSVAPTLQAPAQAPAQQQGQGTTGGAPPNPYTFNPDGSMATSPYGRDMSATKGYRPAQEGQPLQPITEYDYSPERTESGHADISDEQYRQLASDPNVRDNFVSYQDENGQTRWRFYTGGAGRSYDDVYREGQYFIDANGRYVDAQGNPVAVGTHGDRGTPQYASTLPVEERRFNYGPNGQNIHGPTRTTRDAEVTPSNDVMVNTDMEGFLPNGRDDMTQDYVPFTPPSAPPGAGFRWGDAQDETLRNDQNRQTVDRMRSTRPPAPPVTPPSTTEDRWSSNSYRPPEAPYQAPYVPPQSTPSPWQGSLDDLIGEGLDNPSRYDNDLLTAMWANRASDVDDEFDSMVRGEDARLRSQGIRDSTFGGEEMIRRAAGRRDAKSRALQGLTEGVAATQSGDRSRAISDALAAQQQREGARQFDTSTDLARRFGLSDRDFRERNFDWSRTMDTEQFNAQQDALERAFEQWLIERGIL